MTSDLDRYDLALYGREIIPTRGGRFMTVAQHADVVAKKDARIAELEGHFWRLVEMLHEQDLETAPKAPSGEQGVKA